MKDEHVNSWKDVEAVVRKAGTHGPIDVAYHGVADSSDHEGTAERMLHFYVQCHGATPHLYGMPLWRVQSVLIYLTAPNKKGIVAPLGDDHDAVMHGFGPMRPLGRMVPFTPWGLPL
jgi:hypothetical protein